MKAVTYNNAKKNLKSLIEEVCKDSEPMIIVSDHTTDKAVLISLEDYQALEETAYLLNSPANRAHLEKSLTEAQCAKLIEFPEEDL